MIDDGQLGDPVGSKERALDGWVIAAAVFAALTFFGWLGEKVYAWYTRPRAQLDVVNDWSGTARGDTVDGLTVTNTGTGEAYFATDIVLKRGGPRHPDGEFSHPRVLGPRDSFRLAFTPIIPGLSYAVSTLHVRRDGRFKGAVIEWHPLNIHGDLGKELMRQFDELAARPPRWVTGRPTPSLVGPDGVPHVFISNRWPHDDQLEWARVAMGEIPPPPHPAPSPPRRVLLWLWDKWAWATRQHDRRVLAGAQGK